MDYYCRKEFTAMKLKTKQQELIYQCRLLFKHEDVQTVSNLSLVLTISVKEMFKYEQFKKAVYQKIHRGLYGTLSSRDNFNYSIINSRHVKAFVLILERLFIIGSSSFRCGLCD